MRIVLAIVLTACSLVSQSTDDDAAWEAPEAPLTALFDAELLPGDTPRPPATPGFFISPGQVVLSGPSQPSTMTIAVTGANPSSVVRVGYAFGGMQPGPCYAIFGGACFDIGPVVLPLPGVVLTDGSGNGTLVVTVPSTAPGGYIAFQALDLPYGTTSNAVARGIFPAGTVITPSLDMDGDGYAIDDGDCVDSDPLISPVMFDYVGDGVDRNCDDVDGFDLDGDGYAAIYSGGDDCNDINALVNPGADGDSDGLNACDDCDDTNALVGSTAADLVGDGLDANCDGLDGVDGDGDGIASVESGGTDCGDDDAAVLPGAPDVVGDGVDNNCDGTDGVDGDGDGVANEASGGTDCDDTTVLVFPGAADTVGNDLDENCDDLDGIDDDRDSFASTASGGLDCNDTSKDINPAAPDTVGDGLDTNCDDLDGVDGDGDGVASTDSGGLDCDDTTALISPERDEVCGDAIDDNCDGVSACLFAENSWPSADDSDIPAEYLDGSQSTGFLAGQLLPNLQLEDQFGETVELYQFYGKFIFIDLVAMWCGPCQTGAPALQALHDANLPDLVVVANILDNTFFNEPNLADVQSWQSSFSLTHPVVRELDSNQWSLSGYPTYAIVGPDLKLYVYHGPSTLSPTPQDMQDLMDAWTPPAGPTDADEDGYFAESSGGDDCDDGNPNIYPGAPVTISWVDNDCDGYIDVLISDTGAPVDSDAPIDTGGPGDNGPCPAGEELDCDGNCHPSSYIGDGVCDDGVSYPSNFNCAQFNFDDGDCAP